MGTLFRLTDENTHASEVWAPPSLPNARVTVKDTGAVSRAAPQRPVGETGGDDEVSPWAM